MQIPIFEHLNTGWNAEPNAPDPVVAAVGTVVRLSFFLNPFIFDAGEDEVGQLTFTDTSLWRLGATNDEGWYRGQCRYSGIAPAWGEFYEIHGDDPLRLAPTDWEKTPNAEPVERHFLFYLRDETFECLAGNWSLKRGLSRNPGVSAG